MVCPQKSRPQRDVGEQQGVPQTGGHEKGCRGKCIMGDYSLQFYVS